MTDSRIRKRVAVLGAGAIGSSIGADLTNAGEEVTLVDQWPSHVEAMKARGVRVIMAAGEELTPVRAMHVGELCTLREPFDIVLLTAKSYDSCWLVELIKPYLRPEGVLVSLQNSLNDEWIAPLIGYPRDCAAVIELSAEILEPGVVQRNTVRAGTWFALGELHGRVTPRLGDLAGMVAVAGKTEISTNIWGAKWSKLTVNCMSQAVSAILGIADWEISQDPRLLDLSVRLGRECLAVGAALGYRAEPVFGLSAEEFLGATDEILKRTLLTLLTHIGRHARNSMLQDLCKGRRSEIDFMNGLVAKKGREAGIPTPLNDEIVFLTRRIEQGGLRPAAENMAHLEKMI